jgi:hypothetical protein
LITESVKVFADFALSSCLPVRVVRSVAGSQSTAPALLGVALGLGLAVDFRTSGEVFDVASGDPFDVAAGEAFDAGATVRVSADTFNDGVNWSAVGVAVSLGRAVG